MSTAPQHSKSSYISGGRSSPLMRTRRLTNTSGVDLTPPITSGVDLTPPITIETLTLDESLQVMTSRSLSEDYSQILLQNVFHDAICVVDADGLICDMNTAFGDLVIESQISSNSILDFWTSGEFAASFSIAIDSMTVSEDSMSCPLGYSEVTNLEWWMSGSSLSSRYVIVAKNHRDSILYRKFKEASEIGQMNEDMLNAFAINAEEHLARTKEKEKAKEREFELNQALIRSQALQDILETKRHFVRSVSHEVRTPLNVVVSGLQYLTNFYPTFSDEVKDVIEEIKTSCSVAIDILTDLLTYDKIESGVQELDLSEVDIEANVRSVLDQFKVQSRQNGVKLYYCNNFVCDEGKGPIVQGDRMKITQVIRNLVSNAVKFSRANDVVNIELLVEPPDGDKGAVIRLEVKDSGPGISKEDQLRLFREVVQFRPNELQKGAGSGLGLWISRGIVQLHNGSIGVQSEGEGRGSLFFFELPLSNTPHNESLLAQVKTAREQLSESFDVTSNFEKVLKVSFNLEERLNLEACENTKDKGCILVVDDSAAVRKMHIRVLQSSAFTFIEASDGIDAIAKVKEMMDQGKTYSLVLMDSSMPRMSGVLATSVIRKMGYTGKIYGVTGNALKADIDEFMSGGVDRVLIKPLSPKEFASIVEAVARRSTITTRLSFKV